jgi:hypothetical protein
MAFKYFDFECTLWRNDVVRTKFDIYVFIVKIAIEKQNKTKRTDNDLL